VHVGVGVTETELATLIALLKPGGTLVSTARAFGSPSVPLAAHVLQTSRPFAVCSHAH
jgi:hypothetical protein